MRVWRPQHPAASGQAPVRILASEFCSSKKRVSSGRDAWVRGCAVAVENNLLEFLFVLSSLVVKLQLELLGLPLQGTGLLFMISTH